MMQRLSLMLLIGLIATLQGCSEKELDPTDPKKSFGIAKEEYDNGYYDQAITKLGEFKSRFPYSQYAVEAELLIANAHFELGQHIEAAVAYGQFAKLHPKHPKLDFALFRVGESYWKDTPEEVNREQEYTIKAIEEWQKLVDRMPTSPWSEKAKDLIGQGQRRLADSAAFVSAFYCKQEIWHACAWRWIRVAAKYSQFQDLKKRALDEASKALDLLAAEKEKDPTSDKNVYFRKYSPAALRAQADELRRQSSEIKR